MKKTSIKISRLYAGLLGVAITLSPMTSSAVPFRLGEVGGLFDVTLAYGLQWRTEDADERLIATSAGGNSTAGNLDDSTQNYKKGHLTSNIVRGTGELTLQWRNFGLFARGYGFYDFKNEDDCCARTDLTEDAKELVGSDIDLLDHYLSAQFEPGGFPVQFRLGSQVITWGENVFIPGGVNIINPVNIPFFRQPTSTLKDLYRPVGMLWGAATLTETFNVEAFYQYKWRKSIIPPFGSFFSTTDTLSPGATFQMLSGAVSDLGTDLGPLGGFDPNFFRTPRIDSDQPSDQGQFGITLRGLIPQWGDAKVGLHFANYHNRVPIFQLITPNADLYAANTNEATAERAQELQEQFGLSDEEAFTQSFLLGADQYAKASSYRAKYVEDIQMIGLSFDRTTIRTGTSLTAEIAHHIDVPLQIGFDPLIVGWLNGIEPLAFQDSQIGNPGPNQTLKGFIRRDYTLTTLGFNQFFGPQLRAAQTFLAGEVGWLHVWDMPDKSELRIAAGAQTARDIIRSGGQARHYADANSFGYRLAGGLTYANVFRAVILRPSLAWSHDFSGHSPVPLGQFQKDRKSVTVSLRGDYLNRRIEGEISYTSFFGAGRFNGINDRDFVNVSLRYSF